MLTVLFMSTWILVCDAGRARFFMTRGGSGEWVKFEEFEQPLTRRKGEPLNAEQGARTDAHEVEVMRFAHHVAQTLESAHAHNAFKRLVIVAPLSFLGLLRAELNKPVRDAIYATLDKDYTYLDEDELQDRIALP